jgi:hypothetical protein
MALPELGAALDIGEQEGDGAARQRRRRRGILRSLRCLHGHIQPIDRQLGARCFEKVGPFGGGYLQAIG